MTESDSAPESKLESKVERLSDYIKSLKSIAVGFSGGVDSTLLVAVSHLALGDRVIAMTAQSGTHPQRELDGAIRLADQLGVRHMIFQTDELLDARFTSNGPRRCYYCKKRLFQSMRKLADAEGIEHLAHGANLDDLSDFRPGMQAAEELNVLAPLSKFEFSKSDIRRLAKKMGLPNWNRPAMACLATRIPYGIRIDHDLLDKIDRAEAIMRRAGISHCRVRHHGQIARIEIDEADMERIVDVRIRQTITAELRNLGYTFVCLDLEGYISGKMNREL